jgi:hypothetical protein
MFPLVVWLLLIRIQYTAGVEMYNPLKQKSLRESPHWGTVRQITVHGDFLRDERQTTETLPPTRLSYDL